MRVRALTLRPSAQPLESRLLLATTNLWSVGDTYVRDGSYASTNFGTSPDLAVGLSGVEFQRETLLKFNLGALGGAGVTSAKLRVFGAQADGAAASVSTDVYGTSASWAERAVTWNTCPAAGTAKLATINVTSTTPAWYEIDVTAFVQAEQAAGRLAIGLLLKSPAASTPHVALRSRETGFKPTLLITHGAGVQGPASVGVMASDPSASEAGADSGTFTFTRWGGTTTALTVRFTLSGTAAAGSDFAALGGLAVFAAGAATTTVTITPINDFNVENTETVVLTLPQRAGYAIDAASPAATINIADNPKSPFGGTLTAIPGTIEAERFDNGGQDVAYHDTDSINSGESFRTDVGVDIEPTADAGGGFNIGTIRTGEWLEYSVNVTSAGLHTLELRFASANGGGTAHLEVDGVNVTGPVNLPDTGDWQGWQTFSTASFNLTQGHHVLRLAFDNSASGDIGNLNWLRIARAPAAPRWPAYFQVGQAAPRNHYEAAVATVGGKIYVFGGFMNADYQVENACVVYDPQTATWTTLGTIPAGYAETHQGAAADDRYIYLAGGYRGDLMPQLPQPQIVNDQLWRYDTQTNTWLQLTTLPEPRAAGAFALVGRRLYYSGGFASDTTPDETEHFVYDLDTGQWSTAATALFPRDHASTVVLNNKIYVMGGEAAHHDLFDQRNEVQVYDPANDSWTQLASMPISKSHAEASTFVLDGKIVFAGGQMNYYAPTDNVIAYDPTADAWATLAPLPEPRQGAVVQAVGSRIIVALGATETYAPENVTWVGMLPAERPNAARAASIGPSVFAAWQASLTKSQSNPLSAAAAVLALAAPVAKK